MSDDDKGDAMLGCMLWVLILSMIAGISMAFIGCGLSVFRWAIS